MVMEVVAAVAVVVVAAIAADVIGRYANGMNAKMYGSARNETAINRTIARLMPTLCCSVK